MAEIWNLSALCRCCLKDGYFRLMDYPYEDVGQPYSTWLLDTFEITLSTPCIPASNMICEECVSSLSAARRFRTQVELSERQFQEYCTNKATTIKVELEEDLETDLKPPQNPDHASSQETIIKDEPKNKFDWDDNSYDGDNFGEPHIDEQHIDEPHIDEPHISEPNNSAQTLNTESVIKSRPTRKCVKPKNQKSAKNKNQKSIRPKKQESVQQKDQKSVKSEDPKSIKVEDEKFVKPKSQRRIRKKKVSSLKTENGWKCNICQGIGRTQVSLRKHITSVHGYKPNPVKVNSPIKKLCIPSETGQFNTKCFGCNTEFESYDKLKKHERHRPNCGGEQKKCLPCNKLFKRLAFYNIHLYKYHTEIQCKYCEEIFEDRMKLHAHVNDVHLPSKVYICDYCGKQFHSRSVLVRHINLHLGSHNRYACHICGHTFNDVTNVRKHIQQVHENMRAHQCEYCTKNYKTKKSLVEHTRRKHTMERPFVCQVCSRSYVTGYELNLHLEMHKREDKKEYQCEYCPKSFASKQHILQHMRLEHSSQRPFACDVCPLTFVTKYQLSQHVHDDKTEEYYDPRILKRPRNYRCFLCNHVTHSRTDYRIHIKETHNSALPHPCDTCDKTFATKYILERHKLVHTNGKLECEFCNGIFKHEYLLGLHKKRMHGNRHRDGKLRVDKSDFVKCDICNKLVRNMDTHKQMHLKRPFKCELCYRTYSAKNALRRHIKESHLKVYRYKCDICCKKSVRIKAIQKHRLNKHPNAPPIVDASMFRFEHVIEGIDDFISANDE